MEVNQRKLKILQAIIHNYIVNAEPVGSRTISKKYDLGVSSATIRNEMADLEELGYLVQPHTSAGRVPSDKAYRLYVDRLLKMGEMDINSKITKEEDLAGGLRALEETIRKSAKRLAELTNYTSLALAPQAKESRLKHIQLVPIDATKVLAVIVTTTGIVKNATLRIEKELTPDELNVLSNFLTKTLKGEELTELKLGNEQILIPEVYNLRDIIQELLPIIGKTLADIKTVKLYAVGATNILNFPEYNDVAKAKEFLSFLENKESVIDMLLKSGCSDMKITIGEENCYEQLKNCSVVTATYHFNGKTIGKIGIIGPTRMDYSKVIPVVKSMAYNLDKILKEL